ncbi:MAG: sulfite exporter TauE/SafE family protein [Rhodospirillaceae bacterium]|nr:sulfite exporter TauE/SafE family protein [Rhodospirillaceae bacterium]
MNDLAWQAWAVIVLALAAGGLNKGITGLGLPGIAVPIMAIFLGVEQAVMIMVMPTLITNLWLTWRLRDCYREVPEVARVAIAGVPGIALGAAVLYLASEKFLATVLALWVLAYLVLRFMHPELSLARKARYRLAFPVGFASGTLQGATGICAPVIVPYVDAIGANPRTYVFTFSAVFMSLSLTHLIILGSLQAYTPLLFGQSLLAVVPAMIFVPVGNWLRQFIRPEFFSVLIRVLLFVTAARLLYGAWSV